MKMNRTPWCIAAAAVAAMLGAAPAATGDVTLLNVSYDPTRELYDDYNKAFAKHWEAKTGKSPSASRTVARASRPGR